MERSKLLAIGATVGATAVAAAVLLSSNTKPKARGLFSDHSKIAGEVSGSKNLAKSDNESPSYDYVVIGGGTAGCAIASRLSEDPNVSVLLLEAGGSGIAVPVSLIPAAYGQMFHTSQDWDLYTIPQVKSGNKAKYWPRGKMLGGCSAINAMMFHQGHPADYDEWAKIIAPQSAEDKDAADSWRFERFKHYFLKFEKYTASERCPDVDTSLRGASGPVDVGYFAGSSEIAASWLKACANLGIPLSKDFNTTKGTMGASNIMTYISSKKQRVSAEAAYLTPTVLARPNLTVAIHAQVTKILFKGKQAVGVEFVSGKSEKKTWKVRSAKEVVLSAGAVHSPQILMLSGVGPAAHLKSTGIQVVCDLPGVGQHLMDHQTVNVRFRTKPGYSLSYTNGRTIMEQIKTNKALFQYLMFKTGPLTSNMAEAACFVNSMDPKLFPAERFKSKIEDMASEPGGPDLEVFVMPVSFTEHGKGPVAPGDTMCMGLAVLRPTSKGTITLGSANPLEPPVIDAAFCETQHDVDVLVRGMRLMLRMARTKPLADLLLPDESNSPYLDDKTDTLDDTALEKICRERCETLYHPTSSCRMAPLAEGGVVDAKLRVYGVEGLRIADASVFPTIISGHTTAPALAVGEKCADLIRGVQI